MQQQSLDSEQQGKLDQILSKIEELDKRQRKIEARQRKILKLQTKGKTADEEMKEEELMRTLGQKVTGSRRGVTTNQVKTLFDCSKPTALKKMRTLAEESTRINYVEGKGRKADKLMHDRFALGNASANNTKKEEKQ